jgi:acid phosphatase
MGTGKTAQQQIADRMCSWRENHPFDMVITAGDNIYPDGDPALFDAKFFTPYQCLLDGGVQFHAVLGNHDFETDSGQPELDEPAFGFKNGRRNYVLRENGVRFVMVDSNNLDMDWLRNATKERAGDKWTIVVFHHPVYSSGEHGSTEGFRPMLPRLFRKRGVDLVLNGHDHLYEVSKELRGIRYVVSGGGGAALYKCDKQSFSDRCIPNHHFLNVNVKATKLVVSAVPASGAPFDTFSTDGRNPTT